LPIHLTRHSNHSKIADIFIQARQTAMSLYPDERSYDEIPVGARIRQRLGAFIFRFRPGYGQEKMAYYTPANPQTEKQQAWRQVFADGIAAWKALDDEEKAEWWEKAKRKQMCGPHLFQSHYLNTHKLE